MLQPEQEDESISDIVASLEETLKQPNPFELSAKQTKNRRKNERRKQLKKLKGFNKFDHELLKKFSGLKPLHFCNTL